MPKGEICMNQIYRNPDPQNMRNQYIDYLAKADDSTEAAKKVADQLFALDLTVYSRDFTLDSLLYNAFAQSQLDDNIAMHPEQIQIINEIKSHDAIIISAPTSFGKTFCVFEYIARTQPQNIVLIVPTLALVDEYIKKLFRKYSLSFNSYKVHTQLDPEKEYDFSNKSIFILTHDRVVQDESYKLIKNIDLLVIDEVYKLETDASDDRVLVLNMAYYHLSQLSKKYILLAPFINAIADIELLDKKPYFYNTEYSPVVNNVITEELLCDNDRYPHCQKLLNEIDNDDKTLVYFPTVTGMYKYVSNFISNEPVLKDIDESIRSFISWAKDEIHEDWSVVKALERGYAIHNGQMPVGVRLYQLNLYENSPNYNKLLCTSTLLEGVNTSAKNIIITKPSRRSDRNDADANFTAFDFYNLVGRTGRLNQHFVGDAYYLKSPSDPPYKKIDAIRTVKFELTDNSQDVDIQKGNIDEHEDYLAFLKQLGISHEKYLKNIGSHFRFETIKELYSNYSNRRSEIITELKKLTEERVYGRGQLIKILYAVCEGKEDSFKANLLNNLINRNRPKIRTVVNGAMKYYSSRGIDTIISTAIKLKTSYIEHQFYAKLIIIKFFMSIEKVSQVYLDTLDNKVVGAIEQLYFSSSKQKKMLLDIGIYERDVDIIVSVIGNDFDDAFEMKKRLLENLGRLKGSISYISNFIIKSMA